MLTFISCAKTMTDRCSVAAVPEPTVPWFQQEAVRQAVELGQLAPDELGRLLGVNSKLAAANALRYRDFLSPEPRPLPALLSYTGMVFKHLAPADFSVDDFRYAQRHLLISSFLYGLLRPLDAIKNYRLKGNVRLPQYDGRTMFEVWRPKLTDVFIEAVQREGGILLNLASGEMRDLFDWPKVCSSVRVITPEFLVHKGGKLKTVVVYAKMCRGEMTRYALKNRVESPELLKVFAWEGFAFSEQHSEGDTWRYVL